MGCFRLPGVLSIAAALAGCATMDSQQPVCFIDGNLPACMDKIQALQAQGNLTKMTLMTNKWFGDTKFDQALVADHDAPMDLLKYDLEISKLLPELATIIKTNNWVGAPEWKAKFIPLWEMREQLSQNADNVYISKHPHVQASPCLSLDGICNRSGGIVNPASGPSDGEIYWQQQQGQ